jgi:AraC-like DNA-binding protein
VITRREDAFPALYTSTSSVKLATVGQRFAHPSWIAEVRDSNGVDLDTFPSAMGIITRLACGRAKQEGVQVNALLRKVGLTHQQIDDSRVRLAVKAQIRFLELAAITLKDECLGFHLAQKFDLRMIGLFHYVLASSDTLDEALKRAARYSAIVNEGITLRFREGRDLGISFEYAGVARHTDCHQIEFAMVTLVRICRQLTNRHLVASRVSFTHRRKNIAEFRTFFGSNVAFGAAIDELAFSPAIRQMLVVGADPYLNDLLVQYCEEAISARATKPSSFGSSVENAVSRLLPHGKAGVNEVAHKLGVSRRTLARRLASEGLTFADVLQRLKSDLAKRHLADETLSISEIAWLLGYQHVSAFTHAFKRWTGQAPRAVRQISRWDSR